MEVSYCNERENALSLIAWSNGAEGTGVWLPNYINIKFLYGPLVFERFWILCTILVSFFWLMLDWGHSFTSSILACLGEFGHSYCKWDACTFCSLYQPCYFFLINNQLRKANHLLTVLHKKNAWYWFFDAFKTGVLNPQFLFNQKGLMGSRYYLWLNLFLLFCTHRDGSGSDLTGSLTWPNPKRMGLKFF